MANIRTSAVFVAIVCLWLQPRMADTAAAGNPKITVDEIISKHLDALAPAQVRGGAKTRVVEGNVHYTLKMGGNAVGDGPASLATDGQKVTFTMQLPFNDYPGEDIVYDGKKLDSAKRAPGVRTLLGELLEQEHEIVREGLLGGVLSTSWPLLGISARQAKLKYDGIKKVDGVRLYRLSYWPKQTNNGLQTFLFFDPVNFRHVRTQYKLEIQPGQQTVAYTHTRDARYTPNYRYTLEEEFGEFKNFDSFTLPTRWKLRYTYEPGYTNAVGVLMTEWEITVTRIVNNGGIAPGVHGK